MPAVEWSRSGIILVARDVRRCPSVPLAHRSLLAGADGGGGGGDEVGASSHDADHRHDDWPLAIMLPSHFAAPCRPIVAHVAAS